MHFKPWYVAIIYEILVKNMYFSTFLTFLNWPWLSLLLRLHLNFELLKDDVVLGMIKPAVPLKSTDENIIYETMNIRISHIYNWNWGMKKEMQRRSMHSCGLGHNFCSWKKKAITLKVESELWSKTNLK